MGDNYDAEQLAAFNRFVDQKIARTRDARKGLTKTYQKKLPVARFLALSGYLAAMRATAGDIKGERAAEFKAGIWAAEEMTEALARAFFEGVKRCENDQRDGEAMALIWELLAKEPELKRAGKEIGLDNYLDALLFQRIHRIVRPAGKSSARTQGILTKECQVVRPTDAELGSARKSIARALQGNRAYGSGVSLINDYRHAYDSLIFPAVERITDGEGNEHDMAVVVAGAGWEGLLSLYGDDARRIARGKWIGKAATPAPPPAAPKPHGSEWSKEHNVLDGISGDWFVHKRGTLRRFLRLDIVGIEGMGKKPKDPYAVILKRIKLGDYSDTLAVIRTKELPEHYAISDVLRNRLIEKAGKYLPALDAAGKERWTGPMKALVDGTARVRDCRTS